MMMMISEATLEAVGRIGDRLLSEGKTLKVVETAAGGLISAALLSLPGASAWYHGGLIAYSNDFKAAHCGVSKDFLLDHGAVSADATRLMAMWGTEGVDYCLAESSLAYKRPGARSTKPAGLSYMAFASSMSHVKCEERLFEGDREEIMRQIAAASIEFLARELLR